MISTAAILSMAVACDDPPGVAADSSDVSVSARVDDLATGGGRHFATYAHTCAAIEGGLRCWGASESGQLGDGAMVQSRAQPVAAFPSGSGVTAVAAGAEHTCAIVSGRVGCWGRNDSAQVGSPRPFIALEPNWLEGIPGPATDVAAGAHHSCAVAEGRLWCWGRNDDGQTGIAPCVNVRAHCRMPPAPVDGLVGDLQSVSLGAAHSCASTTEGVYCWGANGRGQLGDGTTVSRDTPARVSGIVGRAATAVAAGGRHSCAVVAGGVWCWGANDRGQLGDGSTQQRTTPVRVVGLPEGVIAVATGARHSCAASPGGVHCWGDDTEGQVDGTPGADVNPRPVLAGSTVAYRLAAGEDVTCLAPARGEVDCWGADDFGQLGRGESSRDRRSMSPLPAEHRGGLADRNGDGRITVACLGDSNTEAVEGRPRTWCEILGDLMPEDGFVSVNRGEGGATVVTEGSMIHAADHLNYALANDSVDAVIAAYGTNDLVIANASPETVVSAYREFRARAHAAGVDFFVALTPPTRSDGYHVNSSVEVLNARIAEAFDATEVIDFASDMEFDDYVDELHLGKSGQAKRASAAWRVLKSAAEAP